MTTTAYWLGDGATEVEHLVAQAEVYAPEAAALLDRIGVGEGAAAIDVGCGVLGILPLLCDRAGERGRVVGLDLEPRLLALAAEREPRAETVRADATATGLPSASFDLVHERALLLNLTDPAPAVAEMVRLARPGGVVVLQEPDAAAWLCDPPHPAFDRLRERLLAVYDRLGRDFHTGRRAARLLRDAGLRDIEVRATARVTAPGDYYQTFLLTLWRLLGEGEEEDVAVLREHLPGRDADLPAAAVAGLRGQGVGAYSIVRSTLAGAPAAIERGGRSVVTTEFAPITQRSPIVTPLVITTLAPHQTLSPTRVGPFDVKPCHGTGFSGSSKRWLPSVTKQPLANMQCSPMSTSSTAATCTPMFRKLPPPMQIRAGAIAVSHTFGSSSTWGPSSSRPSRSISSTLPWTGQRQNAWRRANSRWMRARFQGSVLRSYQRHFCAHNFSWAGSIGSATLLAGRRKAARRCAPRRNAG
jgi:ubiquinone/menaquinone biosynthesis C-methylase UbiE